jgi:hypothetical protein
MLFRTTYPDVSQVLDLMRRIRHVQILQKSLNKDYAGIISSECEAMCQ